STANSTTTKPVNTTVSVKAATQAAVKPAPAAPPKPADVLKALFAPVLALLGGMLAFVLLFAIVIGLLAFFAGRYAARIKGAIGEWALHRVLVSELPASYQHYRNLVVPAEKGD